MAKQSLKSNGLDEWKKKLEGVDFTLPSGLEVKLRPATVTDFLLSGEVPDTLTPMLKILDGSANSSEDEYLELMIKIAPLVNAIAAFVTIEPKFSLEPKGDETDIMVMPGDDRLFIFNMVMGQGDDLKPFRP